MPIFTCRITVAFDIADKFTIRLSSGIETERGLDLLILQVTIDGLGATDNLYAIVLGCIIFGQNTCVGVRIITTDNNDSFDIELANNLQALLKLLGCFKFSTSATNHVKATGVTIFFNEVGGYLYVIVVNKSTRSHKETIKAVVGVKAFHFVEQARNHIMTAWCLSAAKYDAYIGFFRRHFIALYELNQGHSVCVGEQFLYFILIVYALCRSTFAHFNCTLKCLW